MFPDFSFEKKLWKKKYDFVAGVDEVGRGALAGPIVAAAVVFKPFCKNIKKIGINDSKKLSPQKRIYLSEIIKKNCLCWAVDEVDVDYINKHGIGPANHLVMRKAIKAVEKKLERNNNLLIVRGNRRELTITSRSLSRVKSRDLKNRIVDYEKNIYLLVDGYPLKDQRSKVVKNQQHIIKGDQKSISIGAASIIAKVYRDELMVKLGTAFLDYDWYKNKGYGTKKHLLAIKKWGITKQHRTKFVD